MRGIAVFAAALLVTLATSSGLVYADWASRFVVYKGGNYTVTSDIVEPAAIGERIGQVTRYSDREGTYRGHFSNSLPKGTLYYSIQQEDTGERIAVRTPEGVYLAAVYSGPSPSRAIWTEGRFWLAAGFVVLGAFYISVRWASRRARQ